MQLTEIQGQKVNRLSEIRIALRLTQAQMADRIGISQPKLSAIEKKKEGSVILNNIHHALKSEFSINPDWFESGSGEMFLKIVDASPQAKNLRLLEVRQALGLSLSEMGQLLQESIEDLIKIEECQEDKRVRGDAVYILAKEKGVNPRWFETGVGEMFSKKTDLITQLKQRNPEEPPSMVEKSGETTMYILDPKERLLTAYEKNILLLEEIARLKDEIIDLNKKIYSPSKN